MQNVLFICQLLTPSIVRERGLPSPNVAGTNRAVRIAQALQSAGAHVQIVSPATAMRQRWRGRFIHPRQVRHSYCLPVLFAWAVGIPILSSIFEPLALLLAACAACKKRRPSLVMIYNYYPSVLVSGLFIKWLYGAKLIFDLEDVCVPRLADWFGRGDARPVQQLVGWFFLKLGLAASDLVLVPSSRFLSVAKTNSNHLVISGCIATEESAILLERRSDQPVKVLISGKLDEEQGVGLVLDAIDKLICRTHVKGALEFHLCGFSDDEAAFRQRIASLQKKGANIIFHGGLITSEYIQLLADADVCVAMQNPHGRHGNVKTPSKVYEYLSRKKVVIASDVGDFSQLPTDVISLCDYDAIVLADRLESIAKDWPQWSHMGERAFQYAQREFSPSAIGNRILQSTFQKSTGV